MKIITLFAMLAVSSAVMSQQQFMNLTSNTGQKSQYALSRIAKLTFVDGMLVTTFNDGTEPLESVISTLSKVVFAPGDATGFQQRQAPVIDYTLYPMPVAESLNISFTANQSGEVQLTVFTLQGCAVITTTQSIHSGANKLQFSTAGLQSGVYICHLIHGKETFSQQIIINKSTLF